MADEAESGLLEQPALVVSAAAGGRRRILAPGGAEVGFAVWRWRGWWRGFALCVHERHDCPLVFTLRRRWALPTRREVRDADGEVVGELAGARILDRWGDAVMWGERSAGSARWRDLRGALLAESVREGDALRLEFHAGVRHDPFACMLLLAAALV